MCAQIDRHRWPVVSGEATQTRICWRWGTHVLSELPRHTSSSSLVVPQLGRREDAGRGPAHNRSSTSSPRQ
eukprot:2294892-Pyramimonas_sp.AAC.1